jgi:hypothetical protein
MRRRLVLLAVATAAIGGSVPFAVASPPSNQGTTTACNALDNDSHGQQGGQSVGPPEDNSGTAIAEGVLGCSDSGD